MRTREHSKSWEISSIFDGFVLRFGGIHATKCLLHWIPIDFIGFGGHRYDIFVQFFSSFVWNQIEPIFWNRLLNIICCAHKKYLCMKISKISSGMLILVVCDRQNDRIRLWLGWETFSVGIGLDFEYNEDRNHWNFWNVPTSRRKVLKFRFGIT